MKNETKSVTSTSSKEANREFLARRSKRLRDNIAAINYLRSLKLNEETIKDFYLGLSDHYTDSKGIVHADALIAPVINAEGKPTSSSVYFNLPKITVNPAAKDFWGRGAPLTYYSGAFSGSKSVFVCVEPMDVWFLKQFVKETPFMGEILFISPTHRLILPAEWYENAFWARFENIYLAHPNDAAGDKATLKISQITGQPSKRVQLPKDKAGNWITFCRDGSLEEFTHLLSEAKVIGAKVSPEANELISGRFGYQPIDIAGTFHNGHLYYPVRTLSNVRDKYRDEYGGSISQVSSRTEVVLIRSDRSIQTVYEVPAPRGTPLDERVLKLSDGTLIESRPKASIHSTWSWNSIEKFCSGKSKTRALQAILTDVKSFLKRAVWLPFERDYDLLTLLVPVTFSQAIFKAVPLVLVTGSPGSGKTALGNAMVKICANASTVGQISAAAVARLIDETKGFVVFDDLESIGRRKREAAHFTELIQALKLSYNRETSSKTWTDVSRGMSVKRLNFYGVKMINNTTGVDDILGSRALKIFMRKVPVEFQSSLAATEADDEIKLKKLRDELHTWTFENVGLIDQTYQILSPFSTDRATEIFAPLRVFAELSQDKELRAGLIPALELQNAVSDKTGDPIKIFKEAVKCLIVDGCTAVSPTQILLEMEKMIADKPHPYLDESAKWKSTAWVGRQLRLQEMVDKNAALTRQLLIGKYVRVYPIRQEFLNSVLRKHN